MVNVPGKLVMVGEGTCNSCYDTLPEGTEAWQSAALVVLCADCVMEAYEGLILCDAEGCNNKGRYSSGYCGLCDLQHNDGKGTRQ